MHLCFIFLSLFFPSIYFELNFWKLLILRKENVFWINADPLWPLHLLFYWLQEEIDRIMGNCPLVLLKLSVENEMHEVGSNIYWNLMSNISSCYKASHSLPPPPPCLWWLCYEKLSYFFSTLWEISSWQCGRCWRNDKLQGKPLTFNAFVTVTSSHHTCLSSNELNYYYMALSFYKGGLMGNFWWMPRSWSSTLYFVDNW